MAIAFVDAGDEGIAAAIVNENVAGVAIGGVEAIGGREIWLSFFGILWTFTETEFMMFRDFLSEQLICWGVAPCPTTPQPKGKFC
jgi:hypothetical protein